VRVNSLVLKSIGRHPAKAFIVSVLANKKALKLKTIEIFWTNTNFFTIFLLYSADNYTDIAYKMVESIAALYNFLRQMV